MSKEAGATTVNVEHGEIRVKGKAVSVPTAQVAGQTVVVNGRWLRVASLKDELLVEGDALTEPESFVARLKATRLSADVFTFAQKLNETTPKYAYRHEWDNRAVVPITTFSDWWDHRAESSVRRAVRKATKVGVVVKVVELDDALVEGIVDIYNETPTRQGRAFWHYQKPASVVKLENSTYPERSIFVGAYSEGELIGFVRLIAYDDNADLVQIISKMKHFDKRPQNALIAKAIEICEQRKIARLTYGAFVYNDPASSLTEFKRRNGFEQVLVPRYYIPLTLKGRLALKGNFHHPLSERIPKPLLAQLRRLRSLWYSRKSQVAV
jgi:hypothetical protein